MNKRINKIITINALKYDGKIHRSWKAKLIQQNKSLLIFVGEFEKEVKHTQLGVIRRGTISYEYYWLDRWYNIFRFHEPNGDLRNFYCNINKPPTFKNDVLNYVDLDVDILVWKDFSYEILDLEEYEQNLKKYVYPDIVISNVTKNLEILLETIKIKSFPFDYVKDNNLSN